jgi:L-ribulose-5-phosphate 3-epimerase
MRPIVTRRRFLGSTVALWSGFALSSPAAQSGKPLPFKVGIITDELTQNLEEALKFISTYSLSYCELREMWNKNIMNLSESELERAKRLIQKHSFHISDIASPIFKYNLPEMPAKPSERRDTFMANFTDQDTEELLNKSFKLAHFFGTDKVRIFSYWRVDNPEKAYPHVRNRLAKAAGMAARNRIVLVLENEHTCNVGTGAELGHIVREIDSPNLRALWDPGNATMLGEVPYPDGYEHVRGLISHVHVKDSRKDPKTGQIVWMPVGSGTIDFRGQFKALRADGYTRTVSLETHYRRPDGNKIESTRESLEGLLRILREV